MTTTTENKRTIEEVKELIEALQEAVERAESGEPVEIIDIKGHPVVFPASDTIKSGCYEIEIRPDRINIEHRA